MKKAFPYIIAAIVVVFGLLTLFLSGSVIFDLFGIREKEGNYVPLVVWSNFISSIIYIFAAYGFIKRQTWTPAILSVSIIILIVAFIGLLIHIYLGGIYETRTIGAMIFRIIVTLIFTILAYLTIKKEK